MTSDSDKRDGGPDAADAVAEDKGGTARKRGRPKFRRRAEARRDEVLDAALALFIKQGYAATRVEDIAANAGISKGTVYLYFESKEALMEGLIDRALSPVALKALSALDAVGLDPQMAIKTVGVLVAERLTDPKVSAIPKLILRESTQFPELAQMYRREVIDKVLPPMTKLIRSNIQKGRFRDVDPELTIRSIIGPVIAHMLIAEVFGIVPEGGIRMDRLVANHIDILFNGLSVNPERKNG